MTKKALRAVQTSLARIENRIDHQQAPMVLRLSRLFQAAQDDELVEPEIDYDCLAARKGLRVRVRCGVLGLHTWPWRRSGWSIPGCESVIDDHASGADDCCGYENDNDLPHVPTSIMCKDGRLSIICARPATTAF